MKTEILKLLKTGDGYVSGQQLCEQFQVSRTAVWKVMEQLKKEGYKIEAVPRKGYRLVESPDILKKSELESLRKTKWAGNSIVCYEETDSTNTRAKAAGEQGAVHGTVFVAESQKQGRGRRGRSWESPAGESIYMSLLLRPEIAPTKASMLTLVMALAVVRAIQRQTGIEAEIKWPNDIVVHGKKVCGILTEMSTEMDEIHYVVIGAGLNVNQTTFPDELKERGTSLRIEDGRLFCRTELLEAVLEEFEECYESFLKYGDLQGLKEEYNEKLVNKNRQVKILDPQGDYEAYASGINNAGELLVTMEDGSKKQIFAGEVSVRGTDGYV